MGEQLGEQGPLGEMLGAVAADEMLGPGQLVAVAIDLRGDILAVGAEGQRRDRPGHGHAGREIPALVGEHLYRLALAGDHHHAMMRLAEHRAARAQIVHVSGHILMHPGVGAIVGQAARHSPFSSRGTSWRR